MEHLWRPSKGDGFANALHSTLDESVAQVSQDLQDLGPAGWMRKAGLFAKQFWLRAYGRFW